MTEKKSTNKKSSKPKAKSTPSANKKSTSSKSKTKSPNASKPSVAVSDAKSSLYNALGDVSSIPVFEKTSNSVVKWFDKLIKKLLG